MADAKKYYWLKLKNDFFDSLRIKKLRKMAGGDTFTIIYLKMQLKSINTEGLLQYCGIEKTFAEELALDLDESVEDVSMTLAYLTSCGLIETSDDINYFLPWVKECIGYESASAERVRKHRENKKLPNNDIKALQCNTDVTKCNTEKEKIREREDKRRKDKRRIYSPSPESQWEGYSDD